MIFRDIDFVMSDKSKTKYLISLAYWIKLDFNEFVCES